MSSLHSIKTKARLGAITLAAGLALSAGAHAESGTEPGNLQLYLGGGGGASPMTLDSRDYSATGTFMMQNPGSGYEITQDNAYAGAYKGFIGLRFLKFFAVEAGFAHLGTVGFTAEWTGSGLTYTDRGDYSASMSYVAGLLTLPPRPSPCRTASAPPSRSTRAASSRADRSSASATRLRRDRAASSAWRSSIWERSAPSTYSRRAPAARASRW